MTTDDDKLKGLLNASGFAFQLALESTVRRHPGHDGWTVTAREHPWKTLTGSGYIDLVVSAGRVHLVIECKRSRDATWMFLMPDEKHMSRSHARICWTNTVPHRRPLAGWGDIQIRPASPESSFCVVRGQGERDAPLLERIASGLAESSDGLAADFLALDEQSAAIRVVVPVIVTTATLVLGTFKPEDVSLASGELDAVSFSTVPYLRFRKSLAAAATPGEYEPEALRDLSASSERTVFVVSASQFTAWLDEFQMDVPSFGSPWESARNRADAEGE